MNREEKIKKIFNLIESKLNSHLTLSEIFNHRGNIGEFRENFIKEILYPYLPKKYSIGNGEIIDKNGEQSKQIDIIIYDEINSNALFQDNTTKNGLYLFESIYGTIEIKSQLNSKELQESIENIKSVKRLDRDNTDASFICGKSIISSRPGNLISYSKEKNNNLLNIIFAYKGLNKENMNAELFKLTQQNNDEKLLLPDFIFNYEEQYVFMKGLFNSKDNKLWIAMKDFIGVKKFDQYFYVTFESKSEFLAFFIVTITVYLAQIQLASNTNVMVNLWNNMFRTFLNNLKREGD